MTRPARWVAATTFTALMLSLPVASASSDRGEERTSEQAQGPPREAPPSSMASAESTSTSVALGPPDPGNGCRPGC